MLVTDGFVVTTNSFVEENESESEFQEPQCRHKAHVRHNRRGFWNYFQNTAEATGATDSGNAVGYRKLQKLGRVKYNSSD
jgi:hypothetical protein